MTLQEIQYKAQGIIHKWRDDDSAPYVEFVEELAHMIVPDSSEDLEEAADNHIRGVADAVKRRGWELETQDITDAFIAGAKWQKEQDDKELSEKIASAYQLGLADKEKKMMKEEVECVVYAGKEGNKWIMTYIGSYESMLKTCKHGDKVRIIVCKKED